MDKFNNIFQQYKNKTDKYGALYIFVMYDFPIEQCNNKLDKMKGLVDQITNSSRRNHINGILCNMTNFLTGIVEKSHINGIYLVSDDVVEIKLEPEWIKTLLLFSCDKFVVKYGNIFQIDWLKKYLLDISYINVLHVKNNDLSHYYLNTTKKKLIRESSEKGFDIINYISKHVVPKQVCVVHGISGNFKAMNLIDTPHIILYKYHKRDSEITEDVEKISNNDVSKQLEIWFTKLLDPKDGKKIIYGKDITIAMQNKMLKTLFCSPQMENKIYNKVPANLLTFELICVKSFGDDVGKKLENEFKGAIGIKYH